MKIGEAIKQLDRLSSPDFMYTVKQEVATSVEKLIDKTFTTTTDPIGRAWAPRKHPARNPLLQKTRKMRRGFYAFPIQTGVRIINYTPYSGYHQYGTRYLDARKMVPDQSTGLPQTWRDMIEKIFIRNVKQAMHG